MLCGTRDAPDAKNSCRVTLVTMLRRRATMVTMLRRRTTMVTMSRTK